MIFPFFRCYSTRASEIQKIADGLILIKKFIAPALQVKLASEILEMGEDPNNGFWRYQGDQRVLNSRDWRGRMFEPLKIFPKCLSEISERCLKIAVAEDQTLQFAMPTHLIALFYKTLDQTPPHGYIPWHRDNGENDGSGKYPVVSFSLGDSCDFLINDSKPKVSTDFPASNPSNLAHRILFESGDALVFGGPKRLMWHAIHKMHPKTAPAELPFCEGRINFTLRYTPEITDKESLFKTVPADQIPRDNPFYKL